MKKIIPICLLVLPLFISATTSSEDNNSRSDRITITSRMDKTAIWVGDTLTYTVCVTYDQNVEFVLSNMMKKEFSLSPFTIRSVTFRKRDRLKNEKLIEIEFLLTSYEVGKTRLTIPAFSLYYFKNDKETKEDALAKAIKIPAVEVGLRSTLTGNRFRLRDFKSIADMDLNRAIISMVFALLGVSFLFYWGARRAWASFRAEKSDKWPSDLRSRENLTQQIIDKISGISGDKPEELIPFYSNLSQLLRQYLSQRVASDFAGLTPEEIEESLDKSTFDRDLVRQIRTVLEQCDRIRYGRDGDRLGKELRHQVSESVMRILAEQGH